MNEGIEGKAHPVRLFIVFYDFLKDLIKSRGQVFQLTKRNLKSRYLGSYLGLLWAFVQPMVTILIFWFVIRVD